MKIKERGIALVFVLQLQNSLANELIELGNCDENYS